MPPESIASPFWDRLSRIALPATLVGALFIFIVPLPAVILDLLLAANITLAVLILLTVLSIRSPQEFSAFPTILLATTLTRLVLNVASTRLVLTEGGRLGVHAAGGVIQAFGAFVAGDQILVGIVMFSILVIIQFVVITKGATRISEVAARFMLDGLPGRQMAIDSDLHAGLIDQHEAARRRDAVYRQADFFGAMDGAGKFVRGDAVAGVFIILVNIVGGLYMGIVNQGMPVADAVGVFTRLTIGDGLVSQVPAFLISLAAGLIVTRSSAETDINRDVSHQLFGRPSVLVVAAIFLGLLALTPLPKIPLLSLAAALLWGASMLRNQENSEDVITEPGFHPVSPSIVVEPVPVPSPTPTRFGHETNFDQVDELLQVDPLELEIGYRMIALADPTRGGDLLERIRSVRQKVARELGLIVPQVRIRDEVNLGPHQYRVKIRGSEVGQGIAYVGRLLAVPPTGLVQRPDGRDGIDPVTGQAAVWIHADGRELAELAGCRILEAASVVSSHFSEIVLNHADELITHEQVGKLLDHARSTTPGLVDEVVPGLLRQGELRRIFQNLVRERVSIRDLESILESLAEHAGRTRDVELLTERVRRALGRQITQPYRQPDGRIAVITLNQSLDERLGMMGRPDGFRYPGMLDSDSARGIIRAVALAVSPLMEAGYPPVLLCSNEARPILKALTRTDLPRLVVLAQAEIPRDTSVQVLGTVAADELERTEFPAPVASSLV